MYKVIYNDCTAVYDSSGDLLVRCPTEQEADEYIDDVQSETL